MADEKKGDLSSLGDDKGGKAKAPKKPAEKRFTVPVFAVCVVAAAVIGVLVGKFLLGGFAGGAVTGKTTLSEGELDSTVGSYVYQGQTHSITAVSYTHLTLPTTSRG